MSNNPFSKMGMILSTGSPMRRILSKSISALFLLSVLSLSLLSNSAFARVKPNTLHPKSLSTLSLYQCRPGWYDLNGGSISHYSSDNYPGPGQYCNIYGDQGTFVYEDLSQNNTVLAHYSEFSVPSNEYVDTCSFEVWDPADSYATAQHVRYDFWTNGSHWIGWPGYDFNQNNYIGVWVSVGSFSVNQLGGTIDVTTHDDGDNRGSIAFAAVHVVCVVNVS